MGWGRCSVGNKGMGAGGELEEGKLRSFANTKGSIDMQVSFSSSLS